MKKIERLNINGFKCFLQQQVEFKQLTVFAGINSLGKSTIIQSILLSRFVFNKASKFGIKSFAVPLNGHFMLNLGNSSNVIHKNAETILFSYKYNDGSVDNIELGNNGDLPQTSLEILNYSEIDEEQIKLSDLANESFYYLNAERLGPRLSYQLDNLEYPHCGWQGEYSLQMLAELNLIFKVDSEKCIFDKLNSTLRNQVIKWMEVIIPDLDIHAKLIQEINVAHVTYNGYTPYNVGFGISYVLPIVLNGLIADKNSIYIVENPEAHLHPAGQSKIGYFLAMLAHSGTQVIVETHSEHIINGMRLFWLKNNLDNSDFLINFLYRNDNSSITELEKITFNPNMELSRWPRGFFDQTQRDLAELVRNRQ